MVTDGTNEPLRRRLETEGKPPRTIVINGCEPEPYVSSENILMTGHLPEVLKGAELLRKASGAERVVFLIEDAERELFELVKSKIYLLKAASFEVFKVPAIYPMGAADFLPAEFSLDSRILNASTAHAAYEAVYFGKPFFERIVTVAVNVGGTEEPRLPFGVRSGNGPGLQGVFARTGEADCGRANAGDRPTGGRNGGRDARDERDPGITRRDRGRAARRTVHSL